MLLQHFKGARLSFAKVAQRAASIADHKRAKTFLAVFRPVFERYQESPMRTGPINFHDMVNRATDQVESSRTKYPSVCMRQVKTQASHVKFPISA